MAGKPYSSKRGPSVADDVVALGSLYLGFVLMLQQRLRHGPRWQYRYRYGGRATAVSEDAETEAQAETLAPV